MLPEFVLDVRYVASFRSHNLSKPTGVENRAKNVSVFEPPPLVKFRHVRNVWGNFTSSASGIFCAGVSRRLGRLYKLYDSSAVRCGEVWWGVLRVYQWVAGVSWQAPWLPDCSAWRCLDTVCLATPSILRLVCSPQDFVSSTDFFYISLDI